VLLVDTNIWLEAADKRARHSDVCRHLLAARRGNLGVTVPTIAETAWVLLDRLGPAAQVSFLRTVASGQVTVFDLTQTDWVRCTELVATYASMKLDVIDASIMAIAEREGLTEIATMNGRDFYAVRPKHTAGFTLVPESIDRY
jgi:uncharacterized protein